MKTTYKVQQGRTTISEHRTLNAAVKAAKKIVDDFGGPTISEVTISGTSTTSCQVWPTEGRLHESHN